MKTVSMLKFRQEAEGILKQVAKGRSVVLTYRGKPIARLEPIRNQEISADDSIYGLADVASETAEPLSHADIDRIVYGS